MSATDLPTPYSTTQKTSIIDLLAMYIKLSFPLHENFLYLPDGYLKTPSELQSDFFEWLYTDGGNDAISDKSGHLAFSYDEYTILRFVNKVILKTSREKAYITNSAKQGKFAVLHF